MAAHLLENLKQRIKVLEMVPAGGGCFEVRVDGDLIYSKLATGVFPEDAAMLDAITDHVA